MKIVAPKHVFCKGIFCKNVRWCFERTNCALVRGLSRGNFSRHQTHCLKRDFAAFKVASTLLWHDMITRTLPWQVLFWGWGDHFEAVLCPINLRKIRIFQGSTICRTWCNAYNFSTSSKPTIKFAQPRLSRVKRQSSPARGYKFGCVCYYMAGHYPCLWQSTP